MDYRELAGEQFDAVASIGMVEHVGSNQIDVYARQVARLVKPGGRVLNHGIARLRVGDAEAGPFSERYVFPDAAPLHLSRIQLALERAGLRPSTWRAFAPTTRRRFGTGRANVDADLDEATRLAGPERIRVWRLYLRAARHGFESGFTSIYQVRCQAAYGLGRGVTRSAEAPIIPPRLGCSGAAAFAGAAGSTQRMAGGRQASWPTLAAYQSITSAPAAAACVASIAFSSSCFARSVGHVALGDRHRRPQAGARVGAGSPE